jgi:uncharacterized protein YfiM (DUF2279 family)
VKYVLVLCLLLPVSAHAQEKKSKLADSFVGHDKVQHFFVSAFLQSFTYSALRATKASHQSSLAGATVTSALFGLGKEVHDRRSYGLFSVRDLVWDAGGIGTATLLIGHTRR